MTGDEVKSRDFADLTFHDDPPGRGGSRGRRRTTQAFIAALKDHPGKWAKYPFPHKSTGAAWNFANNHPGIDARLHSRPDGLFDLWACWIGINGTEIDQSSSYFAHPDDGPEDRSGDQGSRNRFENMPRLCIHADDNGAGAHWLELDEQCPHKADR